MSALFSRKKGASIQMVMCQKTEKERHSELFDKKKIQKKFTVIWDVMPHVLVDIYHVLKEVLPQPSA
jgi:hypothetical protein